MGRSAPVDDMLKAYAVVLAGVLLVYYAKGYKPLMDVTPVTLYLVGLFGIVGGTLGMGYTRHALLGAVVGFIIYFGMLKVIVGV